jgi:hypothetical protein
MKTILKKYNSLSVEYQDIERETSPKKIQAKRVILNKLFALLAACKTNPDKIKNSKKAFKHFCQLREIQVRIKLMESVEPTPIFIEYSVFLKKCEIKLESKIRKFCKKKKLVFPTIENKSKISKTKIYATADKLLDRFIDKMESQAYEYVIEIKKIRKRFMKFKFWVEVLSCIKNIEDAKLEKINMSQKKLDEMYDYDVLIKELIAFNKKHKIVEILNIEAFEQKLIQLFDEFDNDFVTLIDVCKNVIGSKTDNRKVYSFYNINTELLSNKNSNKVTLCDA